MEIYLGKTVIYKPAGGMQYRNMDLVAIVTRVYENERVNLAIFDPTGNIMQNPPTNISVDLLSEADPEPCCKGQCKNIPLANTLQVPGLNNHSTVQQSSPNSAEQLNTQIHGVPDPYYQNMPNTAEPQISGVPNIPFDKSELPAGARMVEHRPATPEEIEAAKAGIGVSNVKIPKKPVKKPVKKPKSPRKPKSGY